MPSEWDEDTKEILILKPAERARRWRWWFVLLVLLGLLAAGYAVYRKIGAAASESWHNTSQPLQLASHIAPEVSMGQAQPDLEPAQNEAGAGASLDMFKRYLVAGVFVFLALVTFVSLLVTLFASEERKVKAASDITKIGLGFFIGVASSFF